MAIFAIYYVFIILMKQKNLLEYTILKLGKRSE